MDFILPCLHRTLLTIWCYPDQCSAFASWAWGSQYSHMNVFCFSRASAGILFHLEKDFVSIISLPRPPLPWELSITIRREELCFPLLQLSTISVRPHTTRLYLESISRRDHTLITPTSHRHSRDVIKPSETSSNLTYRFKQCYSYESIIIMPVLIGY